MAAALVQAVRGDDVPNRLALREVARELASWPIYSAQEGTGATAGGTGAGAAAAAAPPGEEGMARPAARPQIGRGDPDAGSALPSGEGGPRELVEEGLAKFLPDWAGYGVLYVLSVVPVVITLAAVAILWQNSFS